MVVLRPIMMTKALQAQWAGGRDIWPAVPVAKGQQTVRIETRIKQENETTKSHWPTVVQKSILYGLTAYNPRGMLVAQDVNEKQQVLLKCDIINGLQEDFPNGCWWDAASLWEDGSCEPGFIVAFDREILKQNELAMAKDWIVKLAITYEQGAIYEFQFNKSKERLIRSTVPILSPDTQADVEVVIAE